MASKTVDWLYRIANLVVALILIVLGILAFTIFVDFKNVLLGVYGILFGSTIILAEFRMRFLLIDYCGFLNNLFGRGLFYLFCGALLLSVSVQITYVVVLAAVVLAIGFAYILLYFIPNAHPTKFEV